MFKGKTGIGYIIIALVTLAITMLLLYNKPKEINWFPSYVSTHKIPYGTKVLNDIVLNLFPETRAVLVSPFEFLNGETQVEGTYMFVNDRVAFEKAELEHILNWTSKGNSLFLASTSFDEQLLDTLGIKLGNLYGGLKNAKSYTHRLVHPKLRPKGEFVFNKDDYAIFLEEIDTSETTVIATVNHTSDNTTKDKHLFDAIRTKFGKGVVVISTFPKAFTNFFILQGNNSAYTLGLLSYIDDSRNLYIDNYHKSGKSVYTSPMYIFLNTKEFKWAYYLILIGSVVYVIFEGKRKQRAIPVINPLKNQTLAFTATIANMYYERKGGHKEISNLKIDHFLEYIRSRFRMGTIERTANFYSNLAHRSSHTTEEVKKLFEFIEKLRNQTHVSDLELKKLNESIEAFKIRLYGT